MNDFTKEELEILHSAIEYWIKNIALPGSKVSPVIIKKIQSMIDNYCDHEKNNSSLVMAIVCVKCDKPLENWKWCK